MAEADTGAQIPKSELPPEANLRPTKGLRALLLDLLVHRDSAAAAALGLYLASQVPTTLRQHPWRWTFAALVFLWLIDSSLQFRAPPLELGRGFTHLTHKAIATYRGQPEWCEDQARGRFEQDSSDFRDVGWVLELDRYGQWGPTTGWSPSTRQVEGSALLLARAKPADGVVEQFLFPATESFPFASDYPRIQFAVPESWNSKRILLSVSTKWERLSPYSTGYPAVVAISFRYSMPAEQHRVEHGTLLHEAASNHPWRHQTLGFRLPHGAANAQIRIGLHAAYGELAIDNVAFALCD